MNDEEFENYARNLLDERGYIPSDWIIHKNGDIEHLDGENYVYGFVPLEIVLNKK